jgi:hypothetical protein
MVGFHGGDPIGYKPRWSKRAATPCRPPPGRTGGRPSKRGSLAHTGYRNAREEGRQAATTGVMATAEGISVMEPEPAVEAPVLEAKYGITGHLKFDKAMPDSVAQDLHDHKIDQLQRQNVIRPEPRPGSCKSGAARFVGNMIGRPARPDQPRRRHDPGGSRRHAWAERADRGGRQQCRGAGQCAGLVGGAEGAAVMAILEPLNYVLSRAGAQRLRRWPTRCATSRSAAFSAAALHAGVGALVDRTTARARNPVTRALEDVPAGGAQGAAVGLARADHRRTAGRCHLGIGRGRRDAPAEAASPAISSAS